MIPLATALAYNLFLDLSKTKFVTDCIKNIRPFSVLQKYAHLQSQILYFYEIRVTNTIFGILKKVH